MTPQNNQLSKCCKAPVTIEHGCDSDAGHLGACTCSGDGITMWYECSSCHKECSISIYKEPAVKENLTTEPEQVQDESNTGSIEPEQVEWKERLNEIFQSNLKGINLETKHVNTSGIPHRDDTMVVNTVHIAPETIEKVKQLISALLQKKETEHEKGIESLVKENTVISGRFLELSLISSKQEAEYHRNLGKVVDTNINNGIFATKLLKQNHDDEIKELKQQHRAELEYLIKFVEAGSGRTGRKEILDEITRLLTRLDGEKGKYMRDEKTGKYIHSNFGLMCTCNHTLGKHSAAAYKGERPCFNGDDGEDCKCPKFIKK